MTTPPWLSPASVPVRPARAWSGPTDTKVGRIALFDPRPRVSEPAFPAKAFSGEVIPFRVTAFREGHDAIGVHVRLYSPSGDESLHRLSALNDGFDTWRAHIAVREQGVWKFRFEAFADEYATWQHAAHLKIEAGVDVALMREEGALLFERAAADRGRPPAQRRTLAEAAARLRDAERGAQDALGVVTDAAIAGFFSERPLMGLTTIGKKLELRVERERAGVAAWYEFFPRSEGAERRADGTVRSGTFRTAIDSLDRVADMGFQVLYLPPIHPIGTTNRKGRNNTLTPETGDPGSPWAIGSSEGGHDAIHPDLGSMADFSAFLAAASERGLEVALDLALQATPDHPWVREHPEWFTTLADGSIAYAENPPKKYQDIYPVNFDNDPEGIRAEVLRIVRLWIDAGVRTFRVDNPHTKPLAFWEWLIATVNAEHPDIVFLAEAFSRPAVMQSLAKVGFQQSYSYFTWRNTKDELAEFFTELATETADFMRPNLFVNTPDILTEYLQFGGRAAYRVRAVLAATAAPLFGVYAGYELYENVARPGSEENLDNEKYEYKTRDFAGAEAAGDSLAPLLRRLNGIRAEHPALGQLRNTLVHGSDDDAILVYSKHIDGAFTRSGRSDTIIVVVNVDPHSVRETTVHLDLAALGLPEAFEVEDLLTGARWHWGEHNYVRLDAFDEPAHILHVKEIR